MPAYNAEKTLERTFADVPKGDVDDIILVDDVSRDRTVEIARRLGIHTVIHERNRGYGGNQKTCYATALARGADVVVMVHPDHQYDPTVIPHLLQALTSGDYDAAFGSRMLGGVCYACMTAGGPSVAAAERQVRHLVAVLAFGVAAEEQFHGGHQVVLG